MIKKRLFRLLSLNSYIIVVYVFWSYFLGFAIFFSFLPIVFNYIFFLLGGIYLGYKIALLSDDYLKKNKKLSPNHKSLSIDKPSPN